MPAWNELLKTERRARNLTHEALADLAGVSVRSIERYERGQRKPPRATLLRLGRALQLPAASLNALLTTAGFEPRPAIPGRPSSLRVLQAAVATYPWPTLVLNERVEIVAWNKPATRVAELDFARELPLPHQRNLIRIAMMEHFVQRVTNWREVVAVMVNMFAGNQYDFVKPDQDPVYFKSIVDDAAKTDGPHLNALLQLWLSSPPREEEARTTLLVQWQLETGPALSFNCVMTSGNRFVGAQEFDWFPADGATWEFLTTAVSSTAATPATTPAPNDGGENQGEEAGFSTGEVLRQARLGSGLTQQALAARSGVSVYMITSLEGDRRRLTDEIARRLIDALQIDGVTTNELRLSAGLEPEPSDWARFIAGEPQRHGYFRYPGEERAQRAREHVGERIEAHLWPCLVVDERGRILAVNTPFTTALPADAARALAVAENLVALLFSAAVRDALGNWAECAAATLAGLLRQQPGSTNAGIDAAFLFAAINTHLEHDPSPLSAKLR